jgi:hypothetical protein
LWLGRNKHSMAHVAQSSSSPSEWHDFLMSWCSANREKSTRSLGTITMWNVMCFWPSSRALLKRGHISYFFGKPKGCCSYTEATS